MGARTSGLLVVGEQVYNVDFGRGLLVYRVNTLIDCKIGGRKWVRVLKVSLVVRCLQPDYSTWGYAIDPRQMQRRDGGWGLQGTCASLVRYAWGSPVR